MIATDPVVARYLIAHYGAALAHSVEYGAAAAGAVLVLIVGGFLAAVEAEAVEQRRLAQSWLYRRVR